MTTAGTRLTAVIGHPVAHSLSPAIHTAALEADGIDAVYIALEVSPVRFARAMDGLAAVGCVGCNVTLPLKEAAAQYADEASPDVKRARAANVLLFGGSTEAYNTDVGAIGEVLAGLDVDLASASVLILGAGGAARGACAAVSEAGATRILVSNRTDERAQSLASSFVASPVAWDMRADAVSEVDVVINATSVGLAAGDSPLDGDAFAGGRCRAVLDLVYASGPTALVAAARRHGLRAEDGLGVLVLQAAAAYTLFWGRPAPLEVMWRAARAATGRTVERGEM